MRQTTALYKTLRTETGSWYDVQIVRGTVVYGIDKIKSCSLDFAAFSNDGPSIGGTRSNQCQFVVLENIANWSKGESFYIRARIVSEDNTRYSEWITLGTFLTDNRYADRYGNLTIVGFDRMMQLEQTIPSTAETDITWPATAYSVATYLSGVVGLQIDSRTELDNSIPFVGYDEDANIRELFADIASAMGGNWQITPEGKLRLIELDEAEKGSAAIAGIAIAGISVVGDGTIDDTESDDLQSVYLGLKMASLSIGEPLPAITGVELETEMGEMSSSGTDSGLVVKGVCNFVDNRVAGLCLGTIQGVHYSPFNASGALLDPAAEIGDIVVIDGKMYQILTANWTIGTDIICNISAPDASDIDQQYTMVPETTKVLRKANKLVQDEAAKREEAVRDLTNALAAASGLYETTETAQGGGTIFYLHDKSTLAASTIVIKLTAEALGISTDGGQTYTAGFDFATQTAITNILQAAGVNADWINAGSLAAAYIDVADLFAQNITATGTITGLELVGPSIVGNDIVIKPRTNTGAGAFILQGYYDGALYDMFKITYSDNGGNNPYVTIGELSGADGYISFGRTYFQGLVDFEDDVDFQGNKVSGLGNINGNVSTVGNITATQDSLGMYGNIEADGTVVAGGVIQPNSGSYGNAAAMKLLWTNSDPTTSFGSQTVTIQDILSYDVFAVEIKWNDNTDWRQMCFCSCYDGAVLRADMVTYYSGVAAVYRNATVGLNAITFGSGTWAGGTSSYTSGQYAIPTKVYGIKL